MSSHVVFTVCLIQIEREIKNISCYHYLKLDASFGLLGTKRLRLLVKCVHHHQNSVDRNSVRVIAHLLVTSIDRLVACRWRAIELVFTNTSWAPRTDAWQPGAVRIRLCGHARRLGATVVLVGGKLSRNK